MDTYTIYLKKTKHGWLLDISGPISLQIEAGSKDNLSRIARTEIALATKLSTDSFHVRFYRLHSAGAEEELYTGSEELYYSIGRERMDEKLVLAESQDNKLFLITETVEEENV
jgi:hypothetical protein